MHPHEPGGSEMRVRRVGLALVATCLTFAAPEPSSAAVAAPGRTETTSSEVLVNAPSLGAFFSNVQFEPVIAQNPTNPLNIIVSATDFSRFPPCTDSTPSVCDVPGPTQTTGFYTSFDGGNTFPCQGLLDLSPFGAFGGGDTWVAFDSRGVAYYGALAVNTAVPPLPSSFVPGAMFVAKSTDGGCTWPTAAKASGSDLAVFPDKDSIAADANPTSPFRDNVYAAWTKYSGRFGGAGDQIVFARSTDGGATWSSPKGISPADGKQTGFNRTGAVIRVGPNGTVYVLWYDQVQNTPLLRLAISYDGGKTFPKQNLTVAAVATEHVFGAPLPGTALLRLPDFPSFSVGANGTLAASWVVRSGGHSVVMTATSTTGLSWSAPVVATDVPGRSAFFHALAVDPNGKLNVIVNAVDDTPDGTPAGAGVVLFGTYWTQSVDGGATFSSPLEISAVESDPDASGVPDWVSQFLGDFISAATDGSHLYAVWTDARNGTTCDAIDAYRLGIGPAPDIITQCPISWGNTDIYLGTVSY
jgi:hypothetical protein